MNGHGQYKTSKALHGGVSTKEVRQGSSGWRQDQASGKSGCPSLAKLCRVGSEERASVWGGDEHQLLLQLGARVTEVGFSALGDENERQGLWLTHRRRAGPHPPARTHVDAHSPAEDGEGTEL